jgi:hypothetical protein
VNDDSLFLSILQRRAGDPHYRRVLPGREKGGMHVLRGETGGPRDCLNSGQSHGPAAQEEGLKMRGRITRTLALKWLVHENRGCLVAQDEGEEPEPNGQILARELPDLQPSMHYFILEN